LTKAGDKLSFPGERAAPAIASPTEDVLKRKPFEMILVVEDDHRGDRPERGHHPPGIALMLANMAMPERSLVTRLATFNAPIGCLVNYLSSWIKCE
jgi:hypothetical protein